VGQFAGELSSRFSDGSVLRSFLLTLDPLGNVISLVFEDGTFDWHERVRELESAGTAHLFYDPLEDGLEYIWLSWHAVEQSVMERLIGQAFDGADFQPHLNYGRQAERRSSLERFPPSWGVMF
jgi:hypothetical protein